MCAVEHRCMCVYLCGRCMYVYLCGWVKGQLNFYRVQPLDIHMRTCMRRHTSACVSIRQHTSAYVSIRQHTSAYVRAEPLEIRIRTIRASPEIRMRLQQLRVQSEVFIRSVPNRDEHGACHHQHSTQHVTHIYYYQPARYISTRPLGI